MKKGFDYISNATQIGINKKLTVTLELIAANIGKLNPAYNPDLPASPTNPKFLPDNPDYAFPNRWFLKDDWGENDEEIKWNAKAFATMFARAYSPKGCSGCQLVDIVEVGNEPWGYTDAATYQLIIDGFIEGINQYYEGNEQNKIKVLSAAFQANHNENSALAVSTEVLSWKDYMGGRISPLAKSTIAGVNVHTYSNEIIGDANAVLTYGNTLTKNICYPEKVNGTTIAQQTAASRFYYIRNAWKWAKDNLPQAQKNIYVSEFGWDSERCTPENSVGRKTQAIYTIRNLLMMGRYGVKRATLYELKDDSSINCDFGHFANGIWTTNSNPKYIFTALSNMMEKIGNTKFHCALREDPNDVFSYILEDSDGPKYMVAWLARNINYFETGTSNKPLSEIIAIGGTASRAIPLNVNGQIYINDNTKQWYRLDGETAGTLTQSDYYANGQYNLSAIPILIPIVKSVVIDCTNDVTPPTFANCPLNITVTTPSTSAVATWTPPTATDLCPGLVNVTSSYASGASFPVGTTTTVTYTAKDAKPNTPNSATCSFTVTVIQQTGGGNYCASTSSGPWEDWVRGVKFGTISNNFNDENGDGKNSPQNTPGYSNYTVTLQTTVTKGQFYPIVVKPGYSWDGRVVNQYCRVWLDCNGNGLFEDSEKVEAQGANPITLSIPIPATAITGATRMRVSLKSGGYPIACEAASNFAKGEVEDYTVNIVAGTICIDNAAPIIICPSLINVTTPSTACVNQIWNEPVPTDDCTATPMLSAVATNGVIITDNGSTNSACFPVGTTVITYTAKDAMNKTTSCSFNVTVTSSVCVDNTAPIINCPQIINVIAPSTACVNQTWSEPVPTDDCTATPMLSVVATNGVVITDNGSTNSGCFPAGTTTALTYTAKDAANRTTSCSFNIVVASPSSGGNYCASTSSGPWEDWVRGVKFGTISNNFNDENGDGKNSPQNTPGYSNYTTTLQTTVTKGQSYPIVVKPGYSWDGRVVNQYCRVWLDCNGNGLFEDSEKVEAQGANPISLSIPIPATAITGATRMRVSLKSSGYPSSCETASDFAKGEVEDYTVNIIGGTDLCATDVTSPVFTSCPSNITVPTTSTSALATWATPTATDNCGTPTVAGNRNSGESFPVGPTNVTYTATDVKGNIATCIFTVTVTLSNNPCVNDAVQPTFTNCPSDITAVIPVGATCVTKSWVIPTAYDLCTPNPPLNVTTNNPLVTIATNANSSCFPVGTTAITYKATDAKGNMGTCSFNVVATQQSVSANDMSVAISATGTPVSANSSPLVKVQVQNLGSQAFTNVKIKVPFPSGAVTGSTPNPSSGTWSEWCPGVQCFEWTIPSLGANTTATLNLPMYIQNVFGQMTVTATLLSAAPTDGNAANNQASVSLIGNGVQALIAQQSNRTILQGGQNKSLSSALENTITEPSQGFNQPQLQENYKILPNPTTGTVMIDIVSLTEETVVFDFYDAIGRIVKKENISFLEGNNRFIFDLSGLNKGLYFITIDSKNVRYKPLRVAKM